MCNKVVNVYLVYCYKEMTPYITCSLRFLLTEWLMGVLFLLQFLLHSLCIKACLKYYCIKL